MAATPTYLTWTSMLARCNNAKIRAYPDYGGRGISVCERWRDFANFLADMGERPRGHSLDRINNDGNYEPGNCRWATRATQNNNSRHNVTLTIGDRSMTLEAWSRESGIKQPTLSKRLAAGWPMDLMLLAPKLGQKRKYLA